MQCADKYYLYCSGKTDSKNCLSKFKRMWGIDVDSPYKNHKIPKTYRYFKTLFITSYYTTHISNEL